MLTLHIESTSIEDLCLKARSFIGTYGLPSSGPAIVVTDEKPEPKKAGRPKKEEAPAPVETAKAPEPAPAPTDPFADEPAPATKAPELADVRSALQGVSVKYPGEPGMEKVRAILAKFDTFKVSALKAEKYAAVIDECKKA